MILAQLNLLNKKDNLENRIKVLSQYLSENSVDIITLQEIVDNPYLVPNLQQVGFKYFKLGKKTENRNGVSQGVGIFSKFPIVESREINHDPDDSINSLLCEIESKDFEKIFVFTSHLIWGEKRLKDRLNQVEEIDNLAEELRKKNPESPIYFSGDFNDVPQSRTLRFLQGLDLDSKGIMGTFWNSANRDEHWTTSGNLNYLNRITGNGVGIIRHDLVPKRCIDYILNYGWNFGKRGGFLSCEFFGEDLEISDHLGLKTEIIS